MMASPAVVEPEHGHGDSSDMSKFYSDGAKYWEVVTDIIWGGIWFLFFFFFYCSSALISFLFRRVFPVR